MAKEMGLNPRSLIKNIPNKNEMWKAPVKDWIHDPDRKGDEKILFYVFEKIEEAQMWIPDGEIYDCYRRRKKKYPNLD